MLYKLYNDLLNFDENKCYLRSRRALYSYAYGFVIMIENYNITIHDTYLTPHKKSHKNQTVPVSHNHKLRAQLLLCMVHE